MDDLNAFVQQLFLLNQNLKKLFATGNIELLSETNGIIKEMHRLQAGSEEAALMAIDPDCKIIYGNFDMIVKVLRTTEDGVIDVGAQKAINKFLHNIDEAVVNIAKAFDLV